MTLNIYPASMLRHAPKWQTLRHEWKSFARFVATWPDQVTRGSEPADVSPDPAIMRLAWVTNCEEIKSCDFLLIYAEEGDNLRGAFIEAGVAMATFKTIILCGPEGPWWGSWKFHPCCIRAEDLEHAGRIMRFADELTRERND